MSGTPDADPRVHGRQVASLRCPKRRQSAREARRLPTRCRLSGVDAAVARTQVPSLCDGTRDMRHECTVCRSRFLDLNEYAVKLDNAVSVTESKS